MGQKESKSTIADSYLLTTYRSHAFTSYPSKLASYLALECGMEQGNSILDVGCGRGEFLEAFASLGLEAHGVDQSPANQVSSKGAEFTQADFSLSLPFADNQFDFIFSKSVVEHLYYPEKLLAEMHRVLQPKGKIITLTPSFVHIGSIFYQDFTHRTPFTKESLADIHQITGFTKLETRYFIQLPRVWKSSFLLFMAGVLRFVAPSWAGRYSKTVRFSKEVMLLTVGEKASN
jgi:ubiquinone/menaquinone biosynthesis C-methylase UbiE